MILAAGYGLRLRPLTLKTPKPLLCAGGVPLIVHQIKHLAAAGYTYLVINHSWLGSDIENFLKSGNQFGVSIHYSPEPKPLGTGGGIFKAIPLLMTSPSEENTQDPTSSFLVVNADIYANINFKTLFLRPNMLAHLILVDNPHFNLQGDFMLTGNLVTTITNSQQPNLTFSGISVLSPKLFDKCKTKSFSLVDVLLKAIAKQKVTGEYYKGFWIDSGTPERLETLNNYLVNQAKAVSL